MGLTQVRIPQKYYALSDILSTDHICIIEEIKEWRAAVRYSTAMLEQDDYIEAGYADNIIHGMEQQGFYSVTDGVFALLHGSETAGVKESCMSLLISKKPVCFGEKSVQVIFCLASKDKKEHVPAVIRMMRMINDTDFIARLQACEHTQDVSAVIRQCESEVEKCY